MVSGVRSTLSVGVADENKKGQNLGAEELPEVDEPADEEIYTARIRELVAQANDLNKEDYSEKSYQNSGLEAAVANAEAMISKAEATDGSQMSQGQIAELQSSVNAAGKKLEAALEKLIFIADAKQVLEKYANTEMDSTANGKKGFDNAVTALKEAYTRANTADLTVKKEIYEIQLELDNRCERTAAAADLAETLKKISGKLSENPSPYTAEGYKMVKSAFDSADAVAIRATGAADLVKANEELGQAESLAELLGQLNAGTLELALELKKAQSCQKNDYTQESYQSYKEAEEQAKVAAKIKNVTAEQLLNAANQLKTTLVLKARKELSDALKEISAKGLKAADYTNKSWHDYKNILLLAQSVADDTDATAEECQNALDALKKALSVLVIKSGSEKEQAFAALQSALIQAKNAGYVASDYTTESWKAYQKVLDDASALTERSSLDEINAAIQAVEQAAGKLVKKASDSGTNNSDHTTTPGGGGAGSGNTVTKPDSGKDNSEDTGNTEKPDSGDTKGGTQKLIVNTKRVSLVKGQDRKLKIKLTPEGSGGIVSYESSNPSVVTVKNGKLKAKKTGSAVITIKTASGKTASVKVTVVKEEVKAKAIRLNKKKATMKKGSWMLLKLDLKPAKSTDIVKWESSDEKIASVDAYGFVTAKGKGKVTITATTESGKKATCTITVK